MAEFRSTTKGRESIEEHPSDVPDTFPTMKRSTTSKGPVSTEASARISAHASGTILFPTKVNLGRTMQTFVPIFDKGLEGRLKGDSALKRLLDNPPILSSKATQDHDGRLLPIVIAVVRDRSGATRPGILVQLLVDGAMVDRSRTNARGVVLLRAPEHLAGSTLNGVVEVVAPGMEPVAGPVTVPAGKQHTIAEIVLDALPAAASNGNGSLVPDLADNPLDRLPADFSTDLCMDLTTVLGPTPDPILGLVENSSDFRTRRLPLIKRLVVPRVGPTPASGPPRRYLVRLRQEWTFLGYTLGEVAAVDALDPGAVVDRTLRETQRAVDNASRIVEDTLSRATSDTFAHLDQATSIDSLLRVATSTNVHAAAGGFGLMLGPLALGAVGATAGVSSTTRVRSRVNTSLEVNSSLHMAKSLVNHAMRTAVTTQRAVTRIVSTAVNQVSPLLSRVTNLLRWTLYENYAVCTTVEDVVEVQAVEIASTGDPATPLFSDEDIVDYARIFSAGLLEPSLRPHFAMLRRAVAAKRAATLPVSLIRVEAEYSGPIIGAEVAVRIQGEETRLTLNPGGTRAYGYIRLTNPTAPGSLGSMQLDLALRPDLVGSISFPDLLAELVRGSVTLSRIRLVFESVPGMSREQVVFFGTRLRVSRDDTSDSATEPIEVPAVPVFTESDPLFLHVNRNRTYYFGLLAQAALAEPGLRDDAPQFAAFDSNHPLWRLPIIGFEGNRALVISDADESDPEVASLLADAGAATVIQLAAPGAYAEALQGLLKLDDAVGKLHPELLPPLAPAMPPLALVDLAGKQLQVVETAAGGTAGGAGGGVIPPIVP